MSLQGLHAINVFGPRYTSAIGIACLLYDHVLTFESERQAIWANSDVTVLAKFGFVTNRYGSEILLLYLASVQRASSTFLCIAFAWVFTVSGLLFTTLSHFAIIFRIYKLWDRGRMVGYVLAISFSLIASGIGALAILTVVQAQPHLLYITPLRSCYIEVKPRVFPATLGLISLYDIFLIVLTIVNALHMPRRHDLDVIKSLQKDSAGFFLLLFVLRLTNFLASIVGDAIDAFILLAAIWPLCAVVNSRLQIRLESLEITESNVTPVPDRDRGSRPIRLRFISDAEPEQQKYRRYRR